MVTNHTFGRYTVKVVRPAEPDRLLDDPLVRAWNRSDDYMPYWAYLWPGASFLAEVVASESWTVPGDRQGPPEVLEIGCGVGPGGPGRGLCAGSASSSPTTTGPRSRFVDRSVRGERLRCHSLFDRAARLARPARAEVSGHPRLRRPLDERRLVPLVANLLAKLLCRGGLALIACPGRDSAAAFPAALAAQGLTCREEPVETRSDEGRRIPGILYRVGRDA